MSEKLTDELIEKFGEDYIEYKKLMETLNVNELLTFEQYVEMRLNVRKMDIASKRG